MGQVNESNTNDKHIREKLGEFKEALTEMKSSMKEMRDEMYEEIKGMDHKLDIFIGEQFHFMKSQFDRGNNKD